MSIAQPSLRHVFAGGASLAVLSLAVVATNGVWRDYVPILEREAQRVAGGEIGDSKPADVGTAGFRNKVKPERQTVVTRERADTARDADKSGGPLTNSLTSSADRGAADNRRKATDALSAGDEAGAATAAPQPGRNERLSDISRSATEESEAAIAPPAAAPSPAEAAQGKVTANQVIGGQLPQTLGRAAPTEALPQSRGQGIVTSDTQMNAAPPAQAFAKTQVLRAPAETQPAPGYQDQGRDRFAEIVDNPVKLVAQEPVSTFSIDVDTASYSFVRGALNQGVLPQKDAVRVEEMINYFPYDYAAPASADEPFRATVSVMPTPWNEATKLMTVGIKGYELLAAEKPQSNLVFLIDSSGSMDAPDKLPLLRNSFRLLVDTLDPDDTVAIVAYAGSAGTVLEPTRVSEKGKILAGLDRLMAGGSTAGAEGIRQAYLLAEENFAEGGVNRVILATDGDFNVGITSPEELKSFVERKRETGIFLSVLGFGHGNYNDEMMQTLAQNGNGVAAYIDDLSEARKVLVEEATSTLFPIAKDVKIQIEFNPAAISEYRLIGYETRILNREDFNNDKVDAGDIGSRHTVTAIYELTPAGSDARLVDDLRYQQPAANATGRAAPAAGTPNEFAFLKIRYKLPDSDTSTLIERPVTRADEVGSVGDAPQESRFAAAVAAFGQLLRGGRYTGDYGYDDVIGLAQSAKGADPYGYRAGFINLIRLAKSAAGLEPLRR